MNEKRSRDLHSRTTLLTYSRMVRTRDLNDTRRKYIKEDMAHALANEMLEKGLIHFRDLDKDYYDTDYTVILGAAVILRIEE